MERLTERNKHGVAVMRLDVQTGMRGGPVAVLAEYEDSGLEPGEIAGIIRERDAAVKDMEALMSEVSSADACGYCKRDGNGCHSNFGATSCRPKWRGPQGVKRV